jgi:hypothetical protein
MYSPNETHKPERRVASIRHYSGDALLIGEHI